MSEVRNILAFLGIEEEEVISLFERLCPVQEANAGEVLLSSPTENYAFYIHIDGIARMVFTDNNGYEYTEDFLYRLGDSCANGRLLPVHPDNRSVDITYLCEAITPVRYVIVPIMVVERLCLEKHDFALKVLTYYINANIDSCRNKRMDCMMTAEERYRWFLENYPGLSSKISQKYISSFLHMTPEHFSRLKRKMSQDRG